VLLCAAAAAAAVWWVQLLQAELDSLKAERGRAQRKNMEVRGGGTPIRGLSLSACLSMQGGADGILLIERFRSV
jgi:hypothetical protein